MRIFVSVIGIAMLIAMPVTADAARGGQGKGIGQCVSACVHETDMNGTECQALCKAGAYPLEPKLPSGALCTDNAQCTSDKCATHPTRTHGICVFNPGLPSGAGCAGDYQCGSALCLPDVNQCD